MMGRLSRLNRKVKNILTVEGIKNVFTGEDMYAEILKKDVGDHKLQRRVARRWLAVAWGSCHMALGAFLYLVFSGSVIGISLGVFVVYGVLFNFGIVLMMALNQFFRVSLRFVMPSKGQSLDERQQQLNTKAHADARYIVLSILAVAIGVGMVPLPFEAYAAIGITFLLLAAETPQLILAWQLPDAQNDDDEAEVF
ncbi:MAG: hypothetical protein JKY60_11580 [Kordiimonadaceae bacterium]|nr:hypothetical protein [Kordiimonadaceae bacterium]